MKQIKKIGLALREAKHALEQTVLFSTFLDTVVFTFVCLLLTRLLTIEFWYAFIPVPFYAYLHFKRNSQDINFKTIEKKVPVLDEELRTAADNWRKNNEVVEVHMITGEHDLLAVLEFELYGKLIFTSFQETASKFVLNNIRRLGDVQDTNTIIPSLSFSKEEHI